MSHRLLRTTRRPLAAALFVALIAPGMAFAETAKEKALEARVVELERQVQLLLNNQQQQQAQISQAQTDVTAVRTVQAQQPAAATVPAGKQPIQVTTITPGAAPGTTVKIGGFIKADFLATQTGGRPAGRRRHRSRAVPAGPDPGGRRRRQRQALGRGLQRPRQVLALQPWHRQCQRGRQQVRVRSSRWTSSAIRWATRPRPIPTVRPCVTPTCTGTTGWPARPGRTSWTRPRCRKRPTSSARPMA